MATHDDACLMVIDVQGKLATLMHDHPDYIDPIVRMIRGARTLDVPVLWAEQNPEGLGQTVPAVAAALDGLTPHAKRRFSAGADEALRAALGATGRRRVFLVGIEAHICVYQTAVDLLADGYEVEVVRDAVSSRSPENKSIGVERMRDAGARATCVEMALYAWMGTSDHPRFRDILRIVR